jgi:hypothetical protein
MRRYAERLILGAGILALALITAPTVAVAQDTTSAGYMLPHCQARNTLMSAWCHGNVQAAGYLGGALPPRYRRSDAGAWRAAPSIALQRVGRYCSRRPKAHTLTPLAALAPHVDPRCP